MNEQVETLLRESKAAKGGSGTITMPNGRLAVLWVKELYGQLSDGAWENHWFDHPDDYTDYHGLSVEVDADADVPIIRRSNIDGEVPNFLAFNPHTGDDLVDVIGDRMVEYVRDHGYPGYDKETLREDLQRLTAAEVR